LGDLKLRCASEGPLGERALPHCPSTPTLIVMPSRLARRPPGCGLRFKSPAGPIESGSWGSERANRGAVVSFRPCAVSR
jgi:hypothetical protein